MEYFENCTYDTFIADTKLVAACLLITNKLLCQLVREAGGGLRNRIIHDHESINLRFVWEIITEDILELREITKAPLCRKIGVLHQGVIIWGNGNGQIAIQT